jgi:hypothetical protein
LKNFRLLQEELKKLRLKYQEEISEKKLAQSELEQSKNTQGVLDRKVKSLEQYIQDCEKQIIKYASDNLEIKMVEE